MLARFPAQMLSLMDHTPGQRQFRDIETLKGYYRRASSMSEEALDAFLTKRIAFNTQYAEPHRRALVGIARQNNIKLASHDDTTIAQVEEALADGVAIAEFPVTVEAAASSHAAGIKVLMGAPNIVRGGSHSGNIAAIELARAGTLDILSSDYVPASLLLAAYRLPGLVPAIDLPAAMRMVTAAPAKAAGLDDRGVIAAGKLADLVRIKEHGDLPVVRAVWRGGERVM